MDDELEYYVKISYCFCDTSSRDARGLNARYRIVSPECKKEEGPWGPARMLAHAPDTFALIKLNSFRRREAAEDVDAKLLQERRLALSAVQSCQLNLINKLIRYYCVGSQGGSCGYALLVPRVLALSILLSLFPFIISLSITRRLSRPGRKERVRESEGHP